ncbi:MAG: endonuclease/exonuclease/phosphatase family protein [Bacteroidales bacterium]|nr:endonuclease/exonuclease/phosphatase family protein [Bacteroidales bacterium]
MIGKIFKIVFIVINFVLVALMICSTLAGNKPPSSGMAFSLLSYFYLYLLLVNVICVVGWLVVGSKWFLLSTIAIVARCGFLPLYFQIGGTETVEESADDGSPMVKVLSFNAHHFHGVDFDDALTDSNMLLFLDIVDTENPDVLTMQEYIGRGDTVHLTDRLEKRGYSYMTSGYESGSITGEVIFSKMPIVRVARIDGPTKLCTSILWNSDTLRLFCMHLNSYGLDTSDSRHIHNISHGNMDSLTGRSTLHKFTETILAHEQEWNTLKPIFESRDRLTIVAGDFNETPASYFYQQCRKYYKDSYCEAGQGFSTTYHGTFTKSRHTTFPSFRIDMLLHTEDMEAVAYKRIKTQISDHYPIVVTLKQKK